MYSKHFFIHAFMFRLDIRFDKSSTIRFQDTGKIGENDGEPVGGGLNRNGVDILLVSSATHSIRLVVREF